MNLDDTKKEAKDVLELFGTKISNLKAPDVLLISCRKKRSSM